MLRRKSMDPFSLSGSKSGAYMHGILKKYDDDAPTLPGKPRNRPDDSRNRALRIVSSIFAVLTALGSSLVAFVPRAAARGKSRLRRTAAGLERVCRRPRSPLRTEPASRTRAAAEAGAPVPEVYRTERAQRITIAGRIRALARPVRLRIALIGLASVAVVTGVTVLWVHLARLHYDRTHHTIQMELGGGTPIALETTLDTVNAVLAAYDIHIGQQDQVLPPPETPLSDGVVITIARGLRLEIYTADSTHTVYMTQGTVADALSVAGVTYDEDDVVQPAPDTPIKDSMEITMIRVDNRVITERMEIEYPVIYKDDSDLYKGETKIERAGEMGQHVREVRITYMDGREMSREKIRDEVVKEPTSEVVLQGTRSKPATSKPKTTSKATAKPTAKATAKATARPTSSPTKRPGVGQEIDEEMLGHTSSNPADYVVPAAPAEYIEMLSMEATAYTHTGHRTATGAWPKDTRTREHPGTIAVAPDTIPYGTLLYVTGYGYGIAEDTGGFRFNNPMQIDCFMGTIEECLSWGRKRNLNVYIVQHDFHR
ncbi:MAG: DUF348 domain-containing protein [Clostridiales bacterium]|nr:DUF348 domain-containing protein [Clostridiales bacterium]